MPYDSEGRDENNVRGPSRKLYNSPHPNSIDGFMGEKDEPFGNSRQNDLVNIPSNDDASIYTGLYHPEKDKHC